MELIHILQESIQYIPSEYQNVANFMNHSIPIILLAVSLLICFLGYRLVKVWSKVYFFVIGFLLGSFSGVFFMSYNIDISVFIGIGIILGLLGAYFSKYLHKAQIFIINFFSVFLVLPNVLGMLIPNQLIIIFIGFVLAIVMGIVAVKYRYLITTLTTAVQGAMLAAQQILMFFNNQNIVAILLCALIIAPLGVWVQFKIGKGKEEKNTKETKS